MQAYRAAMAIGALGPRCSMLDSYTPDTGRGIHRMGLSTVAGIGFIFFLIPACGTIGPDNQGSPGRMRLASDTRISCRGPGQDLNA